MSETLFIRLGSKAKDKIHWLIWSYEEKEIIASGDLGNADALSQLTEKSATRPVTVFVPSCDVVLRRLTVPGTSAKAIKLAAPYMLEDDIAQDVDDLFFAYANLPKDKDEKNCFVAAVAIEQMDRWLEWLRNADIECLQMMPDILAMPIAEEEGFSALMFEEQVLVRQGAWQGITLDQNAWSYVFNQWLAENDELLVQSYSDLPAIEHPEFDFDELPEELPMALLAANSVNQPFNLLQEQYKVKVKRSKKPVAWLWVAGIAVFALCLNLTIKGITLYQLNSQQDELAAQIVSTYKSGFPNVKKVRLNTLRSVLNRKMAELGDGNNGAGFLMMLSKLGPAIKSVNDLKPQTLKFDAKRNEVRIQATAKGFQTFEKFKVELEKQKLTVKQGSQTNQNNEVATSFSIKG